MDGPKTLNGLILEHMEIIPQTGTSLMIGNYTIEITKSTNNAVLAAKLIDTSQLEKPDTEDESDISASV